MPFVFRDPPSFKAIDLNDNSILDNDLHMSIPKIPQRLPHL
jgi:hypothetical protein